MPLGRLSQYMPGNGHLVLILMVLCGAAAVELAAACWECVKHTGGVGRQVEAVVRGRNVNIHGLCNYWNSPFLTQCLTPLTSLCKEKEGKKNIVCGYDLGYQTMLIKGVNHLLVCINGHSPFMFVVICELWPWALISHSVFPVLFFLVYWTVREFQECLVFFPFYNAFFHKPRKTVLIEFITFR